MFTGLVESVGRVADLTVTASGITLSIDAAITAELSAGDSVAVNGVCLTVTSIDGDTWRADVGPETARITTLGSLDAGQPVNLERSMRADGRFGGHFVQGHVDATGCINALRADGDAHWVTITFPDTLAHLFVP